MTITAGADLQEGALNPVMLMLYK